MVCILGETKMAFNEHEILIHSEWLRDRLGQPGVVLVDTRPAADYWAGHLAGARHFDPFPFHHSGTGEAGMNEFRSQLAWIFSALGITGGGNRGFLRERIRHACRSRRMAPRVYGTP